jgi:5-methylcytosine-specific restriction endonuclease McrA
MHDAHDLSTKLAALLGNEQRAMADFLVALADFDARKAWRELGHASLFAYLRRDLHLSAGAAQYRKTAAELIQAFPEVEVALRGGKLCLSSVVEVAKVLTPENADAVLPRFFGLSRREAEVVAVSIRPVAAAPRRDVVTVRQLASPKLGHEQLFVAPSGCDEPRPRNANPLRPAEAVARLLATADARTSEPPRIPKHVSPASEPFLPQPDTTQPLDASTARLHVTVSRRFLAKLDAARAALSHAKPGARVEDVLETALDLLLEKKNATRHAQVKKPRAVPPVPSSAAARADAAVPAHVKREVWKRSGGRCEFRLASGEACGSTTMLEYDHVVPRALGGPSTIDNLRVCCRSHNDLAARQVFGDAWMDRFRGKSASDVASGG